MDKPSHLLDIEESKSPTEDEIPMRKDSTVASAGNCLFTKPHLKRLRHRLSKEKHVLPDFVSNWKRKHAEKLNINYNSTYMSSSLDVLLKKGTICDFTEKQEQYMIELKSYLHFDAALARYKYGTFAAQEFYSKRLKPIFDGIRRNIKPPIEEDHATCSYIDVMAKVHVDDFIKELEEVVTQEMYRDDTEMSNVSKAVYSQLFYRFATMCHIRPRFGNAAPSYWHRLMGVDVSSKPDFRLCKKGMSFTEDGDPLFVVTVAENKKPKQSEEPLKKRHRGDSTSDSSSSSSDISSSSSDISSSSSEKPLKKRHRGNSNSSSDSSSSSDCHCQISEIEKDLDQHVLGQHAGELLLDARKYSKEGLLKGNDKMLGMIVSRTKVVFTLLDISSDHMDKLYQRKDLDKEKDVATIYYAEPLDILVERDRNELIENFMRVNNIQFDTTE